MKPATLRLLAIGLALAYLRFGNAQSQSVKIDLSKHFQTADSLITSGQFDLALSYLDSSQQTTNDPIEAAYGLVLTARAYDNLGKPDKAFEYYSKAEKEVRKLDSREPLNYFLLYYSFHLDAKSEMVQSKELLEECVQSVSVEDYMGAYIISHAYKVLATTGLKTNDLDSVYYHISQMNKFLEQDTTRGIYPHHYNAMAWFHYKTGDLGSALSILKKYFDSYGIGLDEIDREHAPIVSNIGITYAHLGDYERGEKYQLAINKMLERENLTETNFYQKQLGTIGNLYFNMKRYDESLRHYDEQIALYKEQNENYRTPFYYEEILLEKSQVLAAMNRWPEASVLLNEILAFFSQPKYKDYSLLNVFLFKGMSEILAERYDEAIESLVQSMQILVDQETQYESIAVPVLSNLADAFAGTEQYDLAVSYMDTALWINQGRIQFNSDSLTKVGIIRWQVEMYNDKLEILKRAWESKKQGAALDLAFETIDRANLMLDYARKVLITDDSKLRIAEDFYQYAVYFYLEKYKLEEDEGYLWKALSFNENNKSFLLNTITSQRLVSTEPEYLQLIELREEMKQQMASSAAQGDIINQHIYLEELDSLQSLIDQYADYRHYRTLNPSWIAKNYPDQQILSIHLNKESMYCFLVHNTKISMKAIELTADFDEEILEFRESLTNSDSKLPSISWAGELIGWVSPMLLERLIIVPDGALNYLPFEILSSEENPESFLMEYSNISYLNSLSQPARTQRTRFTGELISFAPSFDDVPTLASADVIRSELAKLPGALKEVVQLNEIFGGESVVEENATEAKFRESAPNSGIIHLATHAIVDDSDPELSKLVFNTTNDSIHDGNLHFYEIYGLDLNASLVTLSACNTGFGKIQEGEGVMSLSRAFAYAGVPSTVVSLWPASDRSTPELMKYFYQNLKEGQAKDLALNNARKQYLETATGKARHPFYWGGFVVIGDNSPIEDGSNDLLFLLPLGAAIVVIVFALRRRTTA